MSTVDPADSVGDTKRLSTLQAIESRILWLATAIVDAANRRKDLSGLKVGGHQASSASMVSIMTSLWFETLTADDRVSVKPHAAPVLHAIEYVLGALSVADLTRLRQFGGLQAYPSRTKDPHRADYSTGSVGLGATAPLWGAVARRYVNCHFGTAGQGRQYALIGDAELDEGAVWEAVLDPRAAQLGELVWVVDFNRQSLDRIIPGNADRRLTGLFRAAGWQVIEVKYGELVRDLFTRSGGAALRERLDAMSNEEYQRLLRRAPSEVRTLLPGLGSQAREIDLLLDSIDDSTLLRAIRDLGGHDLACLREAYRAIDDTRPTVIIAYTLKGYRLPTEGHPGNHSALLTDDQLTDLAASLGVDRRHPWAAFDPDSDAGQLCEWTAGRLRRRRDTAGAAESAALPPAPADLGRTIKGRLSTQAALGRALLDLTRNAPELSERIVTLSPDVTSSTNLGGWVNKVGVWADRHNDWFVDDSESVLHWREHPRGRHIELGIAETNLVGLMGELGATWSRWGEPLVPIGVLYDAFVGRALEPWSFGLYGGGRSILVGTPSGVTLAPEGGAHQSVSTPSIGLEQPGCVSYEPAFAQDLEWCLLGAMAHLHGPTGRSAYLRLSTRPVDQALADVPVSAEARELRRRRVCAGAYLLRRSAGVPDVTLATMGATVTDTLHASDRLGQLGFMVDVVVVTSAALVFRAQCGRGGVTKDPSWIIDEAFPADRAAPLVTVLDGHPHTLSFLAGIRSVRARHLGVTTFGQSGDLESIYAVHGIDAASIVNAALGMIS